MNPLKISSPPQSFLLFAIATLVAWLLYIVLSVDLSSNSLAAATIAKGIGVLMTIGLAFALYRSATLRRAFGAIAAVLGGIGLVALIGVVVLWFTDTRVRAMEDRSTVGFVVSVLAHVFIAWTFLFSQRKPEHEKA